MSYQPDVKTLSALSFVLVHILHACHACPMECVDYSSGVAPGDGTGVEFRSADSPEGTLFNRVNAGCQNF